MIEPIGTPELRPRIASDELARSRLLAEAATLPSLVLSSAAAANAVMLAAGYFSPLRGFHSRLEALAIARDMHTPDGMFWPVPCLNLVPAAPGLVIGQRVALLDPNLAGAPVLAVQRLESIETLSHGERKYLLERIFRTADRRHPGVAMFSAQGDIVLGGPVEVLNYSYFSREFPDTFRTAMQIRTEIAAHGWRRVIAFQTRNPMHRAHEELCKIARARAGADGILIHMLLGRLKPGDLPAAVRAAAIRRMVECYFEPGSVMVAGYGFDMLYAGPREAVLHAAMRQNAGCTDFIVGRDHAGVGSYYGPFDAQAIFREEVPPGALRIRIFEADHAAYSRKLDRVVMKRDVPDHDARDFVELSGTRVRELLAAGAELPPEFARPEVARILEEYYRSAAANEEDSMSEKTLFSRIIDREIPSEIIYEDERCIAFRDINPQAPLHALVVPRKPLPTLADADASEAELLGHLLVVAAKVAAEQGYGDAFRLAINNGVGAGQTVFHLHVHVLGGRAFKWPPG